MGGPPSATVRLAAGTLAVVGAVIGAIGAAVAQENTMLGSWTAVDPASGVPDVLTVTAEHITFGAATPPIPYRVEPDGEALTVYLADGEKPARFVFLDDRHAQLRVPDGPTIALQRRARGASGAVAKPRESVIDAAAEALMMPAYHPLDPSLENLLADGWQVDEVSGADEVVTLLLRKGGHHAFCVLLPRGPDAAHGTAADCRRLN